jgi:DNA-binding transcriptional MerR regulator
MTERNGRPGGRNTVEEDDVVADVDLGLPDRKYFKIGEVASLLGVEAHVLRYWETQFSQLKPHKARSGHRLYRRREVETLLVIKDLLHVQRFTIAGARQALRQQGTTSLLPRAAEQLTLPPTPNLLARHSRVLESTIPSEADDDDDFTDEGDAIDGEGVGDVEDEDEDVLELHLADPLPRGACGDEVEVEIVAADGDALEEALARQLARQKNPHASVIPVEVKARSSSQSTLPTSATRASARAALLKAEAELEAFLERAKKVPDGQGRMRV